MKKYLRYAYLLSKFYANCNAFRYKMKNGIFMHPYWACHILKHDDKFYDKPPHNKNKKITSCLYDEEEKLNNWKYYVFYNKLPLFIGICLNTCPGNTTLKYTPYITDKRYTDEEIYDKLKFTQEEINLIDKTITKFEYNSEFLKNLIDE